MASYEHEHQMEGINEMLEIARLIVRGGWNRVMQVNFEQLFPHGERPADPAAIEELGTFKCAELKPKDQCLICLDTWENAEEGENAIKMPCRHLFHTKCLIIWLKKANTCPNCRHEIRSSNEDYEEYKRQEKREAQRKVDLEELHNSMFS